ncbi:hypothetical protein CsSME_00051267 [Camellia sinensis var. sinensis]
MHSCFTIHATCTLALQFIPHAHLLYNSCQHNLLQSLLVGASLLAMPAIKMIPTSVLWGYFAYMALDSLLGNQFWERILLLFIIPKKQYKILEGDMLRLLSWCLSVILLCSRSSNSHIFYYVLALHGYQ